MSQREQDPVHISRRKLFSTFVEPVKETVEAFTTPPQVPDTFLIDTKNRRGFLGDVGRATAVAASGAVLYGLFEAREALFILPPPSHELLSTPRTSADRTYNAMLASYSIDDGLFNRIGRHEVRRGDPLRWEATLWPTTNAYNAMMTHKSLMEIRDITEEADLLRARRNIQKTNIGIERFWDRDYKPHSYDSVVKPKRPGDMFKTAARIPERYNDDTAWAIHAHTRAVRGRTEDEGRQGIYNQSTLRVEDALVQLLADQHVDDRGGIHQKRQIPGEDDDARNVVSNAPVIQAALRYRDLLPDDQEHAYQRKDYLDQSVNIYNWVRNALYAPRSGMYFDNTSSKKGADTRFFSYCQGAMIGAGALLAEATGDPMYLHEAEVTAKSSLLYYQKVGIDMLNEPLEFVEIYLRNLLYLASVTTDQELAKDIERTVGVEAHRLKTSPKFYDQNTGHINLANPAYAHEQHLSVQAGLVGIFSLDELVSHRAPRAEKYSMLI